MKRLFTTLLIPLFFSSIAAAQNADDWYEVEVIFFEHLNPELSQTESWPLDPGFPDSTKAKQLQLEASEQAYTLLPSSSFQLTSKYKKLGWSKKHRPLLHIAWRQVVPNRNTPDSIHIFTNMDKPPTIQQHINENTQWVLDEQGNVVNIPINGFEINQDNKETFPLDGILKISRGRYLHVETDLLWHNRQAQTKQSLANKNSEAQSVDLYSLPQSFEETQTQDSEEIENNDTAKTPSMAEAFRVQGKLRLRSGEVHYLDNPMIGMLILFTPYAPSLKEEKIDNIVETFGVETN